MTAIQDTSSPEAREFRHASGDGLLYSPLCPQTKGVVAAQAGLLTVVTADPLRRYRGRIQ